MSVYVQVFLVAPSITVMVIANLNTPLMVGQTGNTLTCDVNGAEDLSPSKTYQWTRNNGTNQIQVGNNSMTLPLSPLQLSHAGNYSCSIISTLLNNPVTTNISRNVMIQSKHSYIQLLQFLHSSLTVPDPQSVTITSRPGTKVLNGSNVTLNCSIQMNQNVLASELSLLMVNVQLTRPDGAILNLSNPIIEGTNFIYTAQVISFGDNDVGAYTCNATVRPQPSAFYLIGTGQMKSKPLQIAIGKCINIAI